MSDFLDEVEAEETTKNPDFPSMVQKALANRMRIRAKTMEAVLNFIESVDFRADIMEKVCDESVADHQIQQADDIIKLTLDSLVERIKSFERGE